VHFLLSFSTVPFDACMLVRIQFDLIYFCCYCCWKERGRNKLTQKQPYQNSQLEKFSSHNCMGCILQGQLEMYVQGPTGYLLLTVSE